MSGPSEAIAALLEELLILGEIQGEERYNDFSKELIAEVYDGDALAYEEL
jgi:hypothetical protein